MSDEPSVLLVEDDENLRSAYRLVLESRGLDVREAATAAEAARHLGQSLPDAVVADLGLSDAGGTMVVRRIREAAPGVSLLVITGHDDPELRSRCRELNVSAFEVKPVVGSVLADRIGELIG